MANRVRCMDPFPFEVRLRNRSKWLPIQSPRLRLEESGRHREQCIQIYQTIAPGEEIRTILYPLFTRRGIHRIRIYECDSFFPFRLTRISKLLSAESEPVRIWPAAMRISAEALMSLERQALRQHDYSERKNLENPDPNHFRSYQPGDSKRLINWKLSAKVNGLIVSDDPEGVRSSLFFAIHSHPDHWARPVDFENAIRLLSSAIEESYARRQLAGIIFNNQRKPIRVRYDLEAALDQLSELELNSNIAPEITGLEKGDFVVSQSSNGIVINNWKGITALR